MASEFTIQPAVKIGRKARVFLSGVSGSGKSYTALTWARVLGERVVVIDTENDSALDYADLFEFDHLPLRAPYSVERYVGAMRAAVEHGADIIVLDSLSHAWAGKGGLLSVVDGYRDSFGGGWKAATPLHQELIEHMLQLPVHLIATARSKQDYSIEDGDNGKKKITKLGLAPVQREGLEYEFSVTADLTRDHVLTVTKTRCRELDDFQETKPGTDLADRLLKWLTEGRSVTEQVEALYGEAGDAATADDLAALYKRVPPALHGEVVADGHGGTVPLGTFIATRGAALRAEEAKARRATTQESA